MKLAVVTVAMLCVGAGWGQDTVVDISGTWQGTLLAGRAPQRNVIKITKDGSGYKALDYGIDLRDSPVNPAYVKSVTVQGLAVRLDILAIGAVFDGKLSADGDTITGTWKQGAAQPLVLVRATNETAWTIPEGPAKIPPMPENAQPVFDVATIRLSNPEARGMRFLARGRHFSTTNTSLNALLLQAYELHPRQLTGGPGWMDSEKWDIAGQPDLDGLPSEEQWKAMLQKLLVERFQVKFHIEKKEMAVYELTVVKAGPKLTPSEGNPDGVPHINGRGAGHMHAQYTNMRDWADMLQQHIVDRPVVDRTGLAGHFDFLLDWTPDDAQPDPADPLPGLFRAMEQELGLKLTATRAVVDVMVVDHAEKASAN